MKGLMLEVDNAGLLVGKMAWAVCLSHSSWSGAYTLFVGGLSKVRLSSEKVEPPSVLRALAAVCVLEL